MDVERGAMRFSRVVGIACFERAEEMHDEAEVCEVLFAHLLNGVRTY